MATKKFSFGSPDVTTSKKRGGGPSMGASSLPIGQGLDLRIPSLQPQASSASTFVAPTAPRAAGPTVVPQGSTVAKPSPDLDNLATSLKSLNTNLQNFTTSYLAYEQQENKLAKERAEDVAIKLNQRNGNMLGDINKLSNKWKTDSTNPKIPNDKKQEALANYELIKSLDPRARDFLDSAVQYENGLRVVANLPNHFKNLKNEDGSNFEPNPYTDDGSPSELDIAIQDHLAKTVTNPRVLARLRPQLVAAIESVKGNAASVYAKKQEARFDRAYTVNLNNLIADNDSKGEDHVLGSWLTGVNDAAFFSGMTTDKLKTNQGNLVTTLSDAILINSINAQGRIDGAVLDQNLEFAISEIENARSGPFDQDYGKRPMLRDELEPAVIYKLRNKVRDLKNEFNEKNNRAVRTDTINSESNILAERLAVVKDADTSTDSRDQFEVFIPNGTKDGKQILTNIDNAKLESIYLERRAEINNIVDYTERTLRLQILDSTVNTLRKESLPSQQAAFDILDVYVDDLTVDPYTKLTNVKTSYREGKINKEHYEKLERQVETYLTIDSRELLGISDSSEETIFTAFETIGTQGNLLEGESDADNVFSEKEKGLARQLLGPYRQEAGKIINDDTLTFSQKRDALSTLWSKAQEEVKKWGNQQLKNKEQGITGPTIFEVESQRINELENINTNNIPDNNKGETPGEVTSTVFVQPDGNEYEIPQVISKNPIYERELDEIETLTNTWDKDLDYYNNLVEAGKIKDGEKIKLNGRVIDRASLNQRYNSIDLKINEAEALNNPVLQNEKYWTEGSSPIHTSKGSYVPVDIVPLNDNFVTKKIVANAYEDALVESNQRFRQFGDNLYTSRKLYSNNWLLTRQNELIYKEAMGVDLGRLTGGELTTGPKSKFFRTNPYEIILDLGENRGNVKRNAQLADDIKTVALYEKGILAQQINALASGSPWVPYAYDTNLIIEKARMQPLEYFKNQYKTQFGTDMPESLEQKVIDGLSLENNRNLTTAGDKLHLNYFYRKGLSEKNLNNKDQALINNREDEILIAGGLQPGMLADNYDGEGLSKKKANLRNEMLELIHSVESSNDTDGKGYEAFNQGGADGGDEVLGFTGTYGKHPANKGKKLVNMTIQEILDIQDSGYDTEKYPMTEEGWAKWFASGGIHVAGKYQLERDTIRDAMRFTGIKPTEKFTPEIQDRLGMSILLKYGPTKWNGLESKGKVADMEKLLQEFNKPEVEEPSTIDTSSGLA